MADLTPMGHQERRVFLVVNSFPKKPLWLSSARNHQKTPVRVDQFHLWLIKNGSLQHCVEKDSEVLFEKPGGKEHRVNKWCLLCASYLQVSCSVGNTHLWSRNRERITVKHSRDVLELQWKGKKEHEFFSFPFLRIRKINRTVTSLNILFFFPSLHFNCSNFVCL